MSTEDFQKQVLKALRELSKRMDKIELGIYKFEVRIKSVENFIIDLSVRLSYLKSINAPRKKWKSCRE